MDRQAKAKDAVATHRNAYTIQSGRTDPIVLPSDIYVVMFAYVLGGWKALLSSDAWHDGSYYEATYNVQKKEMYLDWYVKRENICIPDAE